MLSIVVMTASRAVDTVLTMRFAPIRITIAISPPPLFRSSDPGGNQNDVHIRAKPAMSAVTCAPARGCRRYKILIFLQIFCHVQNWQPHLRWSLADVVF